MYVSQAVTPCCFCALSQQVGEEDDEGDDEDEDSEEEEEYVARPRRVRKPDRRRGRRRGPRRPPREDDPYAPSESGAAVRQSVAAPGTRLRLVNGSGCQLLHLLADQRRVRGPCSVCWPRLQWLRRILSPACTVM